MEKDVLYIPFNETPAELAWLTAIDADVNSCFQS